MASTDARPIPLKNAAYRVVFPILDADGDLVTGATGLDSEVSLDQGTFADCTNEATEIATSSGVYYLDLTSGEMNADCVTVIVKTSSSGAKTTTLVLYPQEADDLKVSVTHWLGTAAATPTVAGVPEVDVTHFQGTAATAASGRPEVNTSHIAGAAVSTTTAQIGANVVQVSGDSAAADNLEAAADGTGYNLGGGSVVAASVTGAVGSVTGNVGGNVTGSVGSVAAGGITASSIAADAIGASELAADAVAEIADAVWDEARSGHTTDGTFGQINQAVRSGTAQGGGTNTITLDASASAVDDFYNGCLAWAVGGAGAGQAAVISDYVGSTKVATVDRNWRTNPDNTTVFVLLPGSLGLTSSDLAGAVWGAARASYGTAGTFGEGVLLASTAIQAIWDALTSALTTANSIGKRIVDYLTGDSYARLGAPAGASVSADVAAVKADTAAILIDTGTTLDARIPAALVGGRMDANVGAISSDATAADNAEAFFDGTGYAGTGNTIPTVTTVTNGVNVSQISGDSTAADNLEAMLDGTGGVTLSATVTALSTTERGALAAAILDLADGIETGLTPRQTLRLVAAAVGGKLSGAGTATEVFRNAVADSKARITATVDSSGNRSAITTDLT